MPRLRAPLAYPRRRGWPIPLLGPHRGGDFAGYRVRWPRRGGPTVAYPRAPPGPLPCRRLDSTMKKSLPGRFWNSWKMWEFSVNYIAAGSKQYATIQVERASLVLMNGTVCTKTSEYTALWVSIWQLSNWNFTIWNLFLQSVKCTIFPVIYTVKTSMYDTQVDLKLLYAYCKLHCLSTSVKMRKRNFHISKIPMRAANFTVFLANHT